MNYLAQVTETDLENLEGNILRPEFAGGNLGSVVSIALTYIIPLVGLIMLLFLLYGGFKYLTSGGDQKAVQSAQSTITTAIIGFIIVFASYWIVIIIGRVLGLQPIIAIF